MAEPQAPISIEELRTNGRLRDFDNGDVYEAALAEAVAEGTCNFVVRFGVDRCEIAVDVDEKELSLLMSVKDSDFPLRWINIWDPSRQKRLIGAIGKKYGFSDRLQKSITVWDEFKAVYNAVHGQSQSPDVSRVDLPRRSHGSRLEKDVEQAADGQPLGKPDPRDSPLLRPENVATFKLLQSSLNYTTIDQGDEFICIGANWLHRRPSLKDDKPGNNLPLVPPKHWSWYTLCKDNTVISFHESPVYDEAVPEGESKADWRAKELEQMRSNTQKVLRHLSHSISQSDLDNFLQLTDVRRLLKARNTSTHQIGSSQDDDRAKDCASNLFYYLFEDYSAAIVILGETQRILHRLRNEVFDRHHRHWKQSYKKDTFIRSLHQLSMELRQLRHLFESYKMLISRMLDHKEVPSEDSTSLAPPAVDRLSRRARDRFQRLSDRLQLLMLNPIHEYLDEKTSLSNTYFNLTTQKDSEATARLTRSATLLAKLSVFFIPITFITAFFSVQLPDLLEGYTANTYWGVLGVTAGISFIALFFFSRLLMWGSEALDDNVKVASQKVASFFEKRKAKKLEGDEDD